MSSGPASSRMHTVSPGSDAAWVGATYLGLGPRWPPGRGHGWLGRSGWGSGHSLRRSAWSRAGGAGVDVAALRLRDVGPAPGPQLRAAPARGRARGPRGPARGRGRRRRRGRWRLGAGPGVAASGLLAGAPAAARRTPSVGAQLRPAPALRAATRPGAPLRGRGSCGSCSGRGSCRGREG